MYASHQLYRTIIQRGTWNQGTWVLCTELVRYVRHATLIVVPLMRIFCFIFSARRVSSHVANNEVSAAQKLSAV